jgi:hypothetical protein
MDTVEWCAGEPPDGGEDGRRIIATPQCVHLTAQDLLPSLHIILPLAQDARLSLHVLHPSV